MKDIRKSLRSNSDLKVKLVKSKSKLVNDTKNEDSVDDGGDFKYDWIIWKIPALGRSTHLRKLSEQYHGQKYDYIVVSTRKCPHIVLKEIQLS